MRNDNDYATLDTQSSDISAENQRRVVRALLEVNIMRFTAIEGAQERSYGYRPFWVNYLLRGISF